MSDENLHVDVSSLAQGGTDLERWSQLANRITNQIRTATATYRFAGGTGEMGEQFDTNYKPGEAKALEFLMMLEEVVGGYADDTFQVAQNFEQTNNDADSNTPQP